MRDLLDLLDKILLENSVTEAANLSAGEVSKYPERFEAFISHIQNKEPFYVIGTDEEVIARPSEAKRLLDLKTQGLFTGAIKITDINGKEWPISKFKKTAEFGGAAAKPGEEGSTEKISKEAAALKPSSIGITDQNISAGKLGSVITSNPVLQSTGYGRAVIEMANQIIAGNPAVIPEEFRKNEKLKKAIVDYAGEYLGVLALVSDQSQWYGGAGTRKNFLKWLGGDLGSLIVNFPSKPNTQIADSFATVTNAASGHTLNISSKGTGGGAAPSLSGIKVPDHLRSKKQYQTAIDIIDLCSSSTIPKPKSISQVFLAMNLLNERLPETIPKQFKKFLPWPEDMTAIVSDSLKNKTPMPKYEVLFRDLNSKGTDGGKLTYVTKKAVLEIVNSGAIPEFEAVVLEVLDYNFIQQYASVEGRSGVMKFATQWPAKLDGEVTMETKSGGTDPSKGGFSFKLHPKGKPAFVDPGPVPGEEPVSTGVTPGKTSVSDLDQVLEPTANIKASAKGLAAPADGETANLGRKRRR